MQWPDTRLCRLLGIEHPIIQAPMAGSATPELAVAVSNAGGMGSLGCAEMAPDRLRSEVETIRAGTNRAFNLNFFVHPEPAHDSAVWARTRQRLAPWYDRLGLGEPAILPPKPTPGFDGTKLELLLDLRPPVASFHFGVPGRKAITALKQAGILLLSTATTVAEARALEKAGIDAIIAQGWEAGGHRGSHVPRAPADGIGGLALVPQIADAVKVPVIAAGGIADGRGIAAALALGASGVQIGTGFLRCPEAGTDATRRALLATARDTDTIFTDSVSGRAARAYRNAYTLAMENAREPLPEFPSLYQLAYPLVEKAGPDEASFHLYGQAAALARDLPAGRLLSRLVEETEMILRRLGSMVG